MLYNMIGDYLKRMKKQYNDWDPMGKKQISPGSANPEITAKGWNATRQAEIDAAGGELDSATGKPKKKKGITSNAR